MLFEWFVLCAFFHRFTSIAMGIGTSKLSLCCLLIICCVMCSWKLRFRSIYKSQWYVSKQTNDYFLWGLSCVMFFFVWFLWTPNTFLFLFFFFVRVFVLILVWFSLSHYEYFLWASGIENDKYKRKFLLLVFTTLFFVADNHAECTPLGTYYL